MDDPFAEVPYHIPHRRVGFQHQIPRGFVNGEQPLWQEAIIAKNSTLRCLAGEVYTPTHFYINLYQKWADLENYMKYLQNWIQTQLLNQIEVNLKSRAVWDCLYPGLYVLCFYQGEWHRAIVKYKDAGIRGRITVELIDYGTEHVAMIDTIRYMLRDMLTNFRAQAIKCRLRFDYPQNYFLEETQMVWPVKANDEFFEIIANKHLAVHFEERLIAPAEPYEVEGRGTWIVSVALVIHTEGPHKPLELTQIRKAEMAKAAKKAKRIQLSKEEKDEEKRVQDLNKIERTLGKHPNGALATKVQQGFEDITFQFVKYVRHPTLRDIPEETGLEEE